MKLYQRASKQPRKGEDRRPKRDWSCFGVVGAMLAVILLTGAEKAKNERVGKEIEELAGMWKLARTERSSGTVEVGADVCLVIDPDGVVRIILPDGDDSTRTEVVQYRFDPTFTPKRYQAQSEENGKKVGQQGIYEIDGDTLRFCFLRDPNKRPSRISVDKDHGGGDTLLIYRRRK